MTATPAFASFVRGSKKGALDFQLRSLRREDNPPDNQEKESLFEDVPYILSLDMHAEINDLKEESKQAWVMGIDNGIKIRAIQEKIENMKVKLDEIENMKVKLDAKLPSPP